MNLELLHMYAGGGEGAPAAERDVFRTLLTPAQLWHAVLLSHLGTREAVEASLASDWAQTWCLLEQLQAHTTDKEYESLALLFVTMFDSNVACAFPEDTERLIALSEEGWQLEVASPHNVGFWSA